MGSDNPVTPFSIVDGRRHEYWTARISPPKDGPAWPLLFEDGAHPFIVELIEVTFRARELPEKIMISGIRRIGPRNALWNGNMDRTLLPGWILALVEDARQRVAPGTPRIVTEYQDGAALRERAPEGPAGH